MSLREKPAMEAIWLNTEPGGSTFLRPFLKSFKCDDEDEIIKVNNEHMEEINNLKDRIMTINGKTITINFAVLKSMHDGQELTALTKDILR